MKKNFAPMIRQYVQDLRRRNPQDSVQIKSERELCAIYGVSRPTVRKVLAVLEVEGLISIHHGRGAYTLPGGIDSNVPFRRSFGILLGGGTGLFFDNYYWEIADAAQRELSHGNQIGLPLITFIGKDDTARLNEIKQLRLDGLIWFHPEAGCKSLIEMLVAEKIPLACIGRAPAATGLAVMYDYIDAGRKLAAYFLEKGKTKPILVIEDTVPAFRSLKDSFLAAMEAGGHPCAAERLIGNAGSIKSRLEWLKQQDVEFDGIFVYGGIVSKLMGEFIGIFGAGHWKSLSPVLVRAARNSGMEYPFLDINASVLGAAAGKALERLISGDAPERIIYVTADVIEPEKNHSGEKKL